ncbi:(3,5-dihydroxyphenyl)acetyl-CoA 1,2-dioxygenase DpgC [Micromonospora wenchangensis]|uniref:(3,5-dihydroxyphenyl)acetyl-CoA 1,2-dioxygenase DpgC n=1 Tax=Micromonospora wenchangensis TaxID=1185415 RepID=UPI0033E76622
MTPSTALTRERSLTGELDPDAEAVRTRTDRDEARLAELPDKPERTAAEQAVADELHRSGRELRSRFLSAHTPAVFAELTAAGTRWPRLAELVCAAAERFPGLVPTTAQLAAERARPQAHKEGREIDQAIFFHHLLGTRATGRHIVEAMLRPTAAALALLPTFARSGVAEFATVRLERDGDLGRVTLGNTSCLNAEDDQLTADLETAVDLVLLDDGIRVGLLRGATMTHPRYAGRRVFSAGINLKHLHQGRISYVDFLLGRELGYLSKIVRGLRVPEDRPTGTRVWREKPWLAAVDTFAIGGGMQLLLACDRVVAGADAYFSLPAAQEGIVPGVANLRLGRLVGPRLARDVILNGRKLWAADPQASGICDEAVDPQEVGRAADRAAERLTAPAVLANRHMLNLADEPVDRFLDYLSEFALVQGDRLYSPDVLAKIGTHWAGERGR